eukprot:CAMPEP_0194772228 /NCGR_PEP_ID=MMETSP0323_2-20130528/51401_1 /TAXON_ID=2866 ORGANISM="Crypthecodinium cohnii, Strain Seligo" /NCGR_SAMPLE_ID=MMETSP0323_2 /ASSEMBLY_ACC=CAM_ASM_000346 /LENGTH=74 /DNA_ID=CAMNT_0039706683 /DNA_START=150 /DNA_END=371 /DNA_ORIENTATION=-
MAATLFLPSSSSTTFSSSSSEADLEEDRERKRERELAAGAAVAMVNDDKVEASSRVLCIRNHPLIDRQAPGRVR